MFKMFGINKNKAQALVSRTHKKYCRELKNMVRSELSLIFADIKKECNIGNSSFSEHKTNAEILGISEQSDISEDIRKGKPIIKREKR